MAEKRESSKFNFTCTLKCINPDTGEDELVGRIGVTETGEAYIKPSEYVNPEALRRVFLQGAKNISPGKISRLDSHLPGLMGGFPLPNTTMYNKLVHIIGNSFGSRRYVDQFTSLIKFRGDLKKNGLTFQYDEPAEKSIRERTIAAKMANADSEHYYGAKRESIVPALIALSNDIADNLEVAPGGVLEDNRDYAAMIIDKSEGNQNLVFDDPSDFTKKIKIILGPQQSEKTDMEVLANRVVHGAGFNAPAAEIGVESNSGRKFIRMDNYKIVHDITEGRQEYFLDLLKKPMSEAHQMTYQEMSTFLDQYEFELPEALRDPIRLEKNKMAIFQWALINSATNNTDNHGRNLAVMVDGKGRIDVAPFIDINFDNSDRPMSTWIDGEPPIHKIDIMNNDAVLQVWSELGLNASSEIALDMRDNLARSMTMIPEYAQTLGINVFSGAMEHVVSSVGVQSSALRSLVSQAVEEARNRMIMGRTQERSASSGLEM